MAFTLPEGWTKEPSRLYGTIIQAPNTYKGGGFVTVDDNLRNFTLGICTVRKRGDYEGRGWKDKLYTDAVAALEAALSR